MNKICTRCEKTYELGFFYKNPKVRGGRLHQCKFCVMDSHRVYRKNNEEKVKTLRKTIYFRDRQENIAKAVEWGRANKDKRRIIKKRWRAGNRELTNHLEKRRQARRDGAVGSHTLAEWKEKLALAKGICVYCNIRPADTKDHIIPVRRGGTDYIDNVAPACHFCNTSKKGKLLSEWVRPDKNKHLR